jgi:hypothetical protein
MTGIKHFLAGAALALTAFGAANATTNVAYTINSSPSYVQTDLSLGNEFIVNTNILVTSLGYYDPQGDGFLTQHEVGIFNSAGTLIADIVLAAGTSDPLVSGFRYHAITPVMLIAGETYNIEGEAEVGDPWAAVPTMSDLTVDPAITLIGTNYRYQTDNTLNDTRGGAHYIWAAYGGPGFQFNTNVPEPSSWAMLVLGFGAVGATLRRRKIVLDVA